MALHRKSLVTTFTRLDARLVTQFRSFVQARACQLAEPPSTPRGFQLTGISPQNSKSEMIAFAFVP